jgi:hypothetical protein
MTALLAACRKHLAASCGLHARTEAVRLGAPALARLISALWQRNPPFWLRAPKMQNFGVQNFAPAGTRRPDQAAVHKPRPRLSANQLV